MVPDSENSCRIVVNKLAKIAAVPRQNRGWQRLYIFYISYILLRGLSPQNAFSDLNNISNSCYAGEIASTPQLSQHY